MSVPVPSPEGLNKESFRLGVSVASSGVVDGPSSRNSESLESNVRRLVVGLLLARFDEDFFPFIDIDPSRFAKVESLSE